MTEQIEELSFASLGLHANLLKGIADMGFTEPMPVQAEVIPHILAGKDVIAAAETGSGKTAAFMLPILHRILTREKRRGLKALVLAPTRELALQSTEHLEDLSKYVDARGAAIFGGVAMNPQIRALQQGVDIISATPGRLLDHASRRRIDFKPLETLVLDEADRMLDMGFLPDIRRIISLLPEKRQNVVVSATIPNEILHLINQICRDPVTIQIGVKDRPPEAIRHTVYPVSHEQKKDLLLHLLRKMPEVSSVIIFTRTKERADRLAAWLGRRSIKAACLHGDRDQRERTRALEALKTGASQILVATDIAARGIDIKDLSHVIVYDPPDTPEAYIHRSGRTGRVETEGDAITLMAPQEEGWVLAIENAIGQKLPRLKLPDFEYRESRIAGSYHPRPYYIPTFPKKGRRMGTGGFGPGKGRSPGRGRRR